MVIVGTLLWYKRNKTPLLENRQLRCGNSNFVMWGEITPSSFRKMIDDTVGRIGTQSA